MLAVLIVWFKLVVFNKKIFLSEFVGRYVSLDIS